MREQIPITTDKGTFYFYKPHSRLGDLAYWRESFQKTAKEDVETYLGRQPWDQKDSIMAVAKQFHIEGKPLAPTVSLIPVAAHQESERIMPAMAEFAKQKTDKPFSVLLYMNMPKDAEYKGFTDTMDAVYEAKKTYPELDIRTSDIYEFSEPKIGKIRKNLWDAALYLAYYDGLFETPGDVIAFNHDIDIEWMNRGLVQTVRKHYDKHMNNAAWMGHDRLHLAGTQMRHAYDAARPNMSRVVRWHDMTTRVRSPQATFEAGLVVPLSSYARSGGFNATDNTYETGSLTVTSTLAKRIKRTPLATSPRRFVDRLHDVGLSDVWTNETFGPDDACRAADAKSDISMQRAHDILEESLEHTAGLFFEHPLTSYYSHGNKTELENDLQKRKRLALTVLHRLDTSGNLADIVDKRYSVNQIMENIRIGEYADMISRVCD